MSFSCSFSSSSSSSSSSPVNKREQRDVERETDDLFLCKKKNCAKISLSRSFLFLFDVSFFIRSEESRLFAESVIYVSIEASLRVL